MKPISIVPKATVGDEVKADCIKTLKDALVLAESGEIDVVVMILGRVDGMWHTKTSETMRLSETIGRLEILKQEWIAKLLESEK